MTVKTLGRIYRWIVISIMVQVTLLSYVNFVYLPGNGTVKATAYELPERAVGAGEIRIPEAAENIKASYDGSFVSYLTGGRLEIIDVSSQKSSKSIEAEGMEITFYRWLPDRNMVIYAMKSAVKQDGKVKISTYDMDNGIERSYPDIKGLPKGSKVVDIQLSPLTNVVYVKTKDEGPHARIYKFNIMDNLLYIMKTGVDSVIRETYYKDNLVYQEAGGGVYVRSGGNGPKKRLGPKSNTLLLDIDLKDNVYIGLLNGEGRVEKVIYGKADEPHGSWNQIEPDTPVLPGDVVITPKGKLFRLVRSENCIKSLDGGEKITYTGELAVVHDDYFITRDKDRLKLIALKNGR